MTIELDPVGPETAADPEDFAEEIGITIIGERLDAKGLVKEERHKFTCAGVNPYGQYLDLMSSAGTVKSLHAQREYVEAALVDDDERERFREITHSPGLRLNMSLMDELASLLVRAYAGRPTSPPPGSRPGGRPAGRRSTGGAGGRGSATSGNGRPR